MKDTNRSVRNYEPKLALVPPILSTNSQMHTLPEDIFYPKILNIARDANARLVLTEVADTEQALRVAKLAVEMKCWKSIEIWRDWPDQTPRSNKLSKEEEHAKVGQRHVTFRGIGHGRSVVCWR
jgi:hypothetical protein